MKIVFMGTPDIAKSILESLYNSNHEVLAVVSQPDSKSGRGNKIKFSPVKDFCIENNIDLIQPEKIRGNVDFLNQLKDYNPDSIVVCAYGKILPKEILDLSPYGAINVHASLLPRLRGASPIQSAILLGEEETGITIMKMAEGIDDGDMILKEAIPINNMNYEELYNELCVIGSKLIVKALNDIENGIAVYEKQDESKATYVTTISKSDGKIDFNSSAIEIERKIRAFDPWPGAFSDLNGITFKIWKAKVVEGNGKPGEIIKVDNNGIYVACIKDALLLEEIQVPNKKRVKVKDYLLGNKVNIGDVFN